MAYAALEGRDSAPATPARTEMPINNKLHEYSISLNILIFVALLHSINIFQTCTLIIEVYFFCVLFLKGWNYIHSPMTNFSFPLFSALLLKLAWRMIWTRLYHWDLWFWIFSFLLLHLINLCFSRLLGLLYFLIFKSWELFYLILSASNQLNSPVLNVHGNLRRRLGR